jgi:hypothetical protein
MISILILYFKKELKKDFFEKFKIFRLEIKSFFKLLYTNRISKIFKFDFKSYFDYRIFSNFENENSIYFGNLKFLFFFHIFYFFIDFFMTFIYFFEFLLNIFFKFFFFLLSEFTLI